MGKPPTEEGSEEGFGRGVGKAHLLLESVAFFLFLQSSHTDFLPPIDSVDRLSPTVALLRHHCSSPLVSSGLHSIDILYDVRAPSPSWSERILGTWHDAKPSSRAKAQERKEWERMERRAREGGAFRGKEKRSDEGEALEKIVKEVEEAVEQQKEKKEMPFEA